VSVGNFERDTSVAGMDGRYAVNLSPAWAVWGPNGGFVAAIALRAMAAAGSLPRPAVFHCQFLKAGRFDAAEVLVERVRSGKRSEALRARLVQDGEDILNATLWLTADGMDGLTHEHAPAPDVPKPAVLKSFAELFDNYPDWYPYWRSVEARPSNPCTEPGPPVWRSWMRLNEPPASYDTALAAARIAFWMDLGPWNAAVAAYSRPLTHLAPNLDLHVQFHRFAEASEWLLIDAEAPIARDGLIGTTLRLWDENGELVASGGSTLFCRRNPNYEEELRRLQAQQQQ
jgi:acyl-CoA thioesterase II